MPLMLILILIVLMIQLQSFSRLFLVLSVAPLGLIGVVAALLIADKPLGFVALLGVLALTGMIARNSVILIDQIETERAHGREPWDAVVEATAHRFRPILLTASAAILGMVPIAPTVFWGPMAYAIMGGLAVATLLTLVFLPALYVIWFRIKEPHQKTSQCAETETRDGRAMTIAANPTLLGPVAALVGALIGGGMSLLAAMYTQRCQDRLQRAAAEIAKREAVYADFVMSASNLLLNAYTRDDLALGGEEQRLIGLINRMRLFASPDVVAARRARAQNHCRDRAETECRAARTREESVVAKPGARTLAGVQLDLPGGLGPCAPDRRVMDASHHLILLAGALGLLSILAGLFSARFGTPLLLVFLAIGILFGKEGPVGLVFNDFQAAYLIGSLALTVILFQGGLNTKRGMLKVALWPAMTLATAGVAITAGVICAMYALLPPPPSPYTPWAVALLVGAILAPTDAAAVAVLLRRARLALPERVTAALEVESGLNDPMSIFLTVLLAQEILAPGSSTVGHAAIIFAEEMGGGALLGVSGGYLLLLVLRRLEIETAIYPVLALTGSLLLFGAAQSVGASGFIAVYLAGVIVGTHEHRSGQSVEQFFEATGWLAQIVLFLMLGLLVTPHMLLSAPWLVLAATVVTLLLVARPIACFVCLLPFGFNLRETAFISWVGLRGAVPVYLVIIPMLSGITDARFLFEPAFMVVVISLAVQGWTIAPAARLLGFRGQTRTTGHVSGSMEPAAPPAEHVSLLSGNGSA